MQRLILGPGPHWNKEEGVDHFVDIRQFGNIDTVFNLDNYPWPFPSESYDEISAIHLVEHLKDLLSFMNECHRILKPGGAIFIITPEAGSDPDLTHADPTHVRCYRRHTFINYFTRAEAPKFGYTDKLWAILELKIENACIVFHGTPLK